MFYFSAVVLVVSSALYVTGWWVVPYVYAVSCAGVAIGYLTTAYTGDNRRLRRLNFQQVLAAVLLPASSYLMFKYRNEWFLLLFVSAVLQLYVAIVRRNEEGKDV
jgi:uncharacterized membrane protein YfcA